MNVKIKVKNVGQAFGCIGIVVAASNGRKLHETSVCPYGFNSAAYARAEYWAEQNGHKVLVDERA